MSRQHGTIYQWDTGFNKLLTTSSELMFRDTADHYSIQISVTKPNTSTLVHRKSGDSVSCSFPNVSLVPLCPRQSSLSNQIALSPLKRSYSHIGKASTSNSVIP